MNHCYPGEGEQGAEAFGRNDPGKNPLDDWKEFEPTPGLKNLKYQILRTLN